MGGDFCANCWHGFVWCLCPPAGVGSSVVCELFVAAVSLLKLAGGSGFPSQTCGSCVKLAVLVCARSLLQASPSKLPFQVGSESLRREHVVLECCPVGSLRVRRECVVFGGLPVRSRFWYFQARVVAPMRNMLNDDVVSSRPNPINISTLGTAKKRCREAPVRAFARGQRRCLATA